MGGAPGDEVGVRSPRCTAPVVPRQSLGRAILTSRNEQKPTPVSPPRGGGSGWGVGVGKAGSLSLAGGAAGGLAGPLLQGAALATVPRGRRGGARRRGRGC